MYLQDLFDEEEQQEDKHGYLKDTSHVASLHWTMGLQGAALEHPFCEPSPVVVFFNC